MRNLAIAALFVLVGCDSKPSPPAAAPPPSAGLPPGVTFDDFKPGRVTPEFGGSAGRQEEGHGHVVIPPGAVDRKCGVTFEPVAAEGYAAKGARLVGPVYQAKVDGQDHFRFLKPVYLTIPYDPAKADPRAGPHSISLSVWENGTWKPVPKSYASPEFRHVTAEVDHFSVYAPTQPEDAGEVKVTARWFATLSERTSFDPGPGTGDLFGQMLSVPSRLETNSGNFAWHDEIDPQTNIPRSVFDGGAWEAAVLMGSYRLRNGQSFPGGAGGRASASLAAGQEGVYMHASVRQDDAEGQPELDFNTQFPDRDFEYEYNTIRLKDNNIRLGIFELAGTARSRETVRMPAVNGPARIDEEGNLFCSSTVTRDGHVSTGSVVRIVSPRRVMLKGRILHRIHASGAGDGFITHRSAETSSWAELADKVIAPAGRATLTVELYDPEADRTVSGVLPVAVAGDGTFELPLPYKPKLLLRMRASYQSQKAQLRETCDVEFPMAMLETPRAVSEGGVSAIDVVRRSRAYLRYGGAETEFDLGVEDRPMYGRNTSDGYLVEFKEFGSIFINTFCYKANHVNQNRAAFTLRNVYVPQQEIESTYPAHLLGTPPLESARTRMGTSGTTEVALAGWEICFPTSTLMTLDAQGLEQAGEARVGEFAQAVYDQYRRPQALPENYTWAFPFHTEQRILEIIRDALLIHGPSWMFPRITDPYMKNWPFNTGVPGGKEKYWLISVRDSAGSEWRPWQVTAIMFPCVRARHPGKLELETRMVNVFDARNEAKIIEELSRGSTGTISISHLGYYKRGGTYEGTHVLALLGAVTTTSGSIVRLLFHDPYGDLSQSPDVEGYYATPRDVDDAEHKGAYAPYGMGAHPIKAYKGAITGRYWNVYRPAERPSAEAIRARLLPGE